MSIVWEEAEPIDINGDGEASYDYLAEWDKVISGGPGNNSIHNDRDNLHPSPYMRTKYYFYYITLKKHRQSFYFLGK